MPAMQSSLSAVDQSPQSNAELSSSPLVNDLSASQSGPEKRRLRILFLPADSIKPAISRSAYMARGLSRYADVFYVEWNDPRSAHWQGKHNNWLRNSSCILGNLLRRIRIGEAGVESSFYPVRCSIITDAFVHRLIGRTLSAKIKHAYNHRTLTRLVRALSPDVIFHADSFGCFPIVSGDHIDLSDTQDDVHWARHSHRYATHLRTFLSQALSRMHCAYIVSEEAENHLRESLSSAINFKALPNGADFAEIRDVPRESVNAIRRQHQLENKLVISYIGGNVWFDGDFAARLFAHAEKFLPEAQFVILGNIPPLKFRNVTWVGPVPPQTAAKYYNLSDIGVLLRDGGANPFLQHSVPLKIIQYAAARKPVVGFLPKWGKNGAFSNLFDMTSNNPEVWCNRFKYLSNNFEWTTSMDEVWQTYSWDAISQRIIHDVSSLTNRRNQVLSQEKRSS